MNQNRICPLDLGIPWTLPTYWPCGVPVHRRRDSNSGFRMELENRTGDVKGKGTSGGPTRPKVPMYRPGAHCFVVARKRGKFPWSEGGRSPASGWSQQETGGTPCLDGRRQPSLGGTSRMRREFHVRICGRLGAKFPGPTRQLETEPCQTGLRRALRKQCLRMPPGDYRYCACSRLHSSHPARLLSTTPDFDSS